MTLTSQSMYPRMALVDYSIANRPCQLTLNREGETSSYIEPSVQ